MEAYFILDNIHARDYLLPKSVIWINSWGKKVLVVSLEYTSSKDIELSMTLHNKRNSPNLEETHQKNNKVWLKKKTIEPKEPGAAVCASWFSIVFWMNGTSCKRTSSQVLLDKCRPGILPSYGWCITCDPTQGPRK